MTTYIFEPPHDELGPNALPKIAAARMPAHVRIANDLIRRYGAPRSFSVLKVDGVYRTVQSPNQDLIDSATEYYAGGHIHEVSEAIATALTDAGYTVQET